MDVRANSQSFAEITRELAVAQPDRIALSFEGRDTTYAEFETHTNQVANALLDAGVKNGDRLAYFGKNSDSYFEFFLARPKWARLQPQSIGVWPGPKWFICSRISRAPILFVGPEFVDMIASITGQCPALKTIIAAGESALGWPAYRSWRDAAAAGPPQAAISPEDDVLQLYTSGTTGQPKGVMLAARNLMNLRALMDQTGEEWAKWSASDVSLMAMPIGHIGGTGWGFWTLSCGAKGIVLRDFDPGRILDLIESEKSTSYSLYRQPCRRS